MGNNYLVNWSLDGKDGGESIACSNAREAYLLFVKDKNYMNCYKTKSVGVWRKDGSPDYDEFDDHLKEKNDSPNTFTSSKDPHEPMVATTPGATYSLPKEEKLDRIYDVLNHIRWIGISIGCMFGMTFIVPQFCSGG